MNGNVTPSLPILVVTCLVSGLGLPAAAADPIAECRALAAGLPELTACLDTRLEAGARAMEDALGGARAAARDVDQRSGRDAAVLGVEASQQAWAAYRDTACPTRAAFVANDGEAAAAVGLACRLELTLARTDELLALPSLTGNPR